MPDNSFVLADCNQVTSENISYHIYLTTHLCWVHCNQVTSENTSYHVHLTTHLCWGTDHLEDAMKYSITENQS